MNDRPDYLAYLGRCAETACEGLNDKAQWWKPFLGVAAAWGVLSAAGRVANLPQTYVAQIVYEASTLVLSAAIVFIWGMATAPARLDARAASRIRRLERDLQAATTTPISDLSLRLDGGIVVEMGTLDAGGNGLPTTSGFFVNVKNNGTKTARNCQAYIVHQFSAGYPAIYPISAPFDLRPGADRHFPVIRYREDQLDRRAFVYFLDPETWKVNAGGSAWLCPPGAYEIKVFSDDNHAASVQAILSTDHDFSRPARRNWFFEPAGGPS